MYNIAIIGDRVSIQGFLALGLDAREARTGEEAAALLSELVRSERYAAIFVTEELFAALGEEIARYKDLPLPAITAIPGKNGATGYGMTALKRATERAVGTNLLFKD